MPQGAGADGGRRHGEGAGEAGAGSGPRARAPRPDGRPGEGDRPGEGARRADERDGREEPREGRPEIAVLTRAHTDFLTEEQRMIRDMAREFAQGELAPNASQ